MEENKFSKLALSIIGIALLLVVVIGITYAAFTATKASSANTINSGTVSMSFSESSNIVNLSNALPVTSNASAKASTASGAYFQFVVSSTVNAAMTVNYDIIATKVTTLDSGYSLLPNTSVQFYLTKVNGSTETALYDNTAYAAFGDGVTAKLASGSNTRHTHTAAGTISTTYRFRMFIPSTVDASSWTSSTKLEYKVRIDVSGTV